MNCERWLLHRRELAVKWKVVVAVVVGGELVQVQDLVVAGVWWRRRSKVVVVPVMGLSTVLGSFKDVKFLPKVFVGLVSLMLKNDSAISVCRFLFSISILCKFIFFLKKNRFFLNLNLLWFFLYACGILINMLSLIIVWRWNIVFFIWFFLLGFNCLVWRVHIYVEVLLGCPSRIWIVNFFLLEEGFVFWLYE